MQGMVFNALLQTPQGSLVQIVGIDHRDESKSQIHAHQLLCELVKNRSLPLPTIIELEERYANLKAGDRLNLDILFIMLVDYLVIGKANPEKYCKIIAGDARNHISTELSGNIGLLDSFLNEQMSKRMLQFEDPQTALQGLAATTFDTSELVAQLKKLRCINTEKKEVSLGEYLDYLQNNLQRMKLFNAEYPSDVLLAAIQQYEKSYDQTLNFFQALSRATPFNDAIAFLCQDWTNGASALAHHKQISDTLLEQQDFVFMDAMLMKKLLDCLKTQKAILVIVGLAHAEKLFDYCKEGNMKVLETPLCLSKAAGLFTAVDRSTESENSLVNTVLRNARMLLNHLPTREISSPAIIHECVVCHNKEHLQMCSRCQKIRYCSVDCQKKDWLEHKKICSALK